MIKVGKRIAHRKREFQVKNQTCQMIHEHHSRTDIQTHDLTSDKKDLVTAKNHQCYEITF